MRDDDYANAAHIPGGESYYERWDEAAAAFRADHDLKEVGCPYGAELAQTYDLFHPARLSRGTVVFVHGGYWKAGSPRMFSHLAAGPLAAGFTVAMVGYTLAPAATIGRIVEEVSMAIGAVAAATDGPIYLVGHSAGGQLVARMVCTDHQPDWLGRVARVMPISPLADLAPLRETSMNEVLGIDVLEAQANSPMRFPRHDVPVTIWVGADERPVFLDHASWLHEAWACDLVVEPGKHHFDVIEGLEDPKSAMMQALLADT